MANFLDLVKARYSARAYEQRAVEQEKIDYILENPQVYDKMSHSSTELYNKYFTVDKMVGGYKEVYNSMVGEEQF